MRRPACIVVVLLCQLCLTGPVPAADKPDAPPQSIQELQTRLEDVLNQDHVPGAGIALFNREGVIWAGGVGYADLEAKKPVTADTLFRVGSITKSFVAIALLQLAEQGKLDLDARLSDLAPEIPVTNPWAQTDPVTLAEVLEHTAGFDDMHFPREYNFHEAPDIALRTVMERSAPELVVRWRPGSRSAYSNVDYLVAGYLLEKLTGEKYERYVTEQVLRRLDMDKANLTLDAATRAELARGYQDSDPHVAPLDDIYLRPAGALAASATELAHLGIMLLDRGQWHRMPFLTAASVTRMETPYTSDAARHGLEYGYGLANYSEYIGGYEFHGHDGSIDGFVSRYAYAPDQGRGFVMLFNSDASAQAFREASALIVSYLMRDMPKPLIPAPVPVSPSVLDSMSGYYREENPRNQVSAVVDYLLGVAHLGPDDAGSLKLSGPFVDPKILVPAGTGLWRRPENPGPDTVFYVREDGKQVLDLKPDSGGAYLVKTGVVSAYGPLVLVGLALLLMLSCVLFAPVWVARKLLGRMRGVHHWNLRLLPLATTAVFTLMMASVLSLEPMQAGTVNVKTATFFLASLLFVFLSFAALVQSLRAFRWYVHPVLRWHTLLVSTACAGLSSFLMAWGIVGLRLWNF